MTTPFEVARPDNWADPALANGLAKAIKRVVSESTPGGVNDTPDVTLRYGVVTAVGAGTVNVKVGGDPTATTGIPSLNSYRAQVNDVVALLVTGKNQYLALGESGSPFEDFDSSRQVVFADPPSAFPDRTSMSYVADNTGSPTPSVAATWSLFTAKRSDLVIFQVAQARDATPSGTNDKLYYRQGYDRPTDTADWGPWQEIVDQRSLAQRAQTLSLGFGALHPRLDTATQPTRVGLATWWSAWSLPDSASTFVGGSFAIPAGWLTANVDVLWTPGNTTGGDVVMRSVFRSQDANAAVSANGHPLVTVAASTVANTLQKTRLATSTNVSAAAGTGLYYLGVERQGAAAGDTLAASIVISGIQLTRVT